MVQFLFFKEFPNRLFTVKLTFKLQEWKRPQDSDLDLSPKLKKTNPHTLLNNKTATKDEFKFGFYSRQKIANTDKK